MQKNVLIIKMSSHTISKFTSKSFLVLKVELREMTAC